LPDISTPLLQSVAFAFLANKGRRMYRNEYFTINKSVGEEGSALNKIVPYPVHKFDAIS